MSSREKSGSNLRGYGLDEGVLSRIAEEVGADHVTAADGSAKISRSFSFGGEEPAGQILLLGKASGDGDVSESRLDDIFLPPVNACIEIDLSEPLARIDLLSRVEGDSLLLSLTTASAFPLFLSKAFCQGMSRRGICTQEESDKMEIALQEAVSNALIHGNLEISSDMREDLAGYKIFSETIATRLKDPVYGNRHLLVEARWEEDKVEIEVADEGPGYELRSYENSSPERAYGRGMELISMLCSGLEVRNGGRSLIMEFPVTPSSDRPVTAPRGEEQDVQMPAGASAAIEALPAAAAADALLDRRILVVDDDVIARELILSYLSVYGFRNLETAEDGVEALEKIDTFRPDLVILDVVMPRMDGFEVCQKLRENIKYQDLPVLVQTAYDKPEDREHVFAAGATDMVIKPIHKMELVARVRIHLEKHLLIQNLRLYRERVASELDFARGMQRDLLPSANVLGSVLEEHKIDVAAHFAPSSELGGDFWGMLETGEGNLGVYIVDFTGHGVMSALNTFRLHTLLHEARYFSGSPAVFLKSLNRRLCDLLPLGQFATMIYGVVDRKNDTFTYAASAAPSPLIGVTGSEGQDLQFFEGSGLPLGISKGAEYENRVAPLPPNGMVFLYSDALTESVLGDGTSLEEEGLKSLASKRMNEPNSKSFITGLLEDFMGLMKSPPTDDLTAVCLIRKE